MTLQQKKHLCGRQRDRKEALEGDGTIVCREADSYALEPFEPSRVHSHKPSSQGLLPGAITLFLLLKVSDCFGWLGP